MNKIAICKGEDGDKGRNLLSVDYIFLYCLDFLSYRIYLFKNKNTDMYVYLHYV